MIMNWKGKFDEDVLMIGNNFKLKYEQVLEAYNKGQCAMVLIKNMVATSKGDWFSKHNITQSSTSLLMKEFKLAFSNYTKTIMHSTYIQKGTFHFFCLQKLFFWVIFSRYFFIYLLWKTSSGCRMLLEIKWPPNWDFLGGYFFFFFVSGNIIEWLPDAT